MVRLHLDKAQALADRQAVTPEAAALGDTVDFTHEAARVEGQGVIALLELVKLLHHGDRYYDVVVLEMPERTIVVQDDIGVQDEDFWFAHSVIFFSPPLQRYASGIPKWSVFLISPRT